MAAPWSRVTRWILCLCYLWVQAQCQILSPYQTLPKGAFNNISGETGQFDEPSSTSDYQLIAGEKFTICWDTAFANARLVLGEVYNTSEHSLLAENATTLASGINGTTFDWTVECLHDCNSPHVLLLSTVYGGSNDPTHFWSRLFWISPSSATTSSSTSSSSLSTASTLRFSSTLTTSTTASSATVSLAAVTTDSTATVPTDSPAEGELKTSPITSRPRKSSAATIGGAVGGVIGVLLLLVGAFFVWRHYRNKAPKPEAAKDFPEMESL